MRLYPSLPACNRKLAFHKQGIVETEIGLRMCITDEEADLLYGIVRMLKPKVCLETGTYLADSAFRIGQALRDNDNGGHLTTCDTTNEMVDAARSKLASLPVTVIKSKGVDLIAGTEPPFDFVFIDSGSPEVRAEELHLLGPHNVSPYGIVVVHDLCVDYQSLYDILVPWDWPHLVFDSQVGIGIFQRPGV